MKLDENLPGRVAALLRDDGHDVATVTDEGLGGSVDTVVAQAAAHEGRMIVTLDRRFADIRRHPPGQHPGMLILQVRDQRPMLVEATLRALLDQHHLEDLAGCIVVAGLGLIRVRR
ncbi:MAG TPA: DUF5615 family PIN-like protein [Dehalococcoidia bacterium]|nr:DUF5615 family PIN-like protein [Dehalococcoidia bacterium]